MAYGDAEEERKWLARSHAAQSKRLTDAILRGDDDIARVTVGVPPADAGEVDPVDLSEPDFADLPEDLDEPDDPDLADELDEPERTDPPTAEAQFREHREALLFNLEWAGDFLPHELLADWARRIEPLDLARSATGLDEIGEIRGEYQWAAGLHRPPNSTTRRMEWDYYVPRIGHEIDWLERLFRHVLSFG